MCVCVCGLTALDPPVITEDANNEQLQGHVICLTRGFYFKRTYSKRRSLKDLNTKTASPPLVWEEALCNVCALLRQLIKGTSFSSSSAWWDVNLL